jgi:hypothetical protein
MNSLFQDGSTVGWIFGESFLQQNIRDSILPEKIADEILSKKILRKILLKKF